MRVQYVYEQPLVLNGKMRWPDFSVEDDARGVTYYWEHLGLLSDPAYAQRWASKRKAYLAEGGSKRRRACPDRDNGSGGGGTRHARNRALGKICFGLMAVRHARDGEQSGLNASRLCHANSRAISAIGRKSRSPDAVKGRKLWSR